MDRPEKIETPEHVLAGDAESAVQPPHEPLICLSCGAQKHPGVSLPCGH